MNKQDQVVEFLLSYGWAIIASIIVIGILFYCGVFSPREPNLIQSFCESKNLAYDSNIPNSCFWMQNETAYEINVVKINESYYFKRIIP